MRSLKQFHWFELLILVSLLGIHFYAASSAPHNFPSRWFTRDDAYYYFKVAQNISEGYGSTFDGINLTNGYHPLWMLVCIPIFYFARFDLILPLRILMMVMAVISIITSILLFRLLRKSFSEWIAIGITSFWAFSINVHSIITQQGMETGIVALSLVMLLSFISKLDLSETVQRKLTTKQAAVFGGLCLFVILSRLDGIFLVLFAFVYVLWNRQVIFRTFLLVDVLVAYVVTVLAFVARTGLPQYLAAFDRSAILFTSLVLFFQWAVGYPLGLFDLSRWKKPLPLLVIAYLAVFLAVFPTTGVMAMLGLLLPEVILPRAVPLIYIGLVPLVMVLVRFITIKLYLAQPNADTHLPFVQYVSIQIKLIRSSFWEGFSNIVLLGWIPAGGLMVYMLLNRLLFGTLMPVSGQIKRWWGTLSNDVYGGPSHSIANMFGVDPQHPDGWFYISLPFNRYARILIKNFDLSMNNVTVYWFLFVSIMVITLILFLVYRREIGPRMKATGFFLLFTSSFFHVFFYGSAAYSAKHEWYWVPQMLTVVIFFGLLAQIAYDRIKKYAILNKVAIGLVILYSLNLLYGFSHEMITRMPMVSTDAEEPYVDILPILEKNTETGSLIGMTGGGNVGYYIKDRTIMNMDGLINSYEYFQHLQENKGGEFYTRIGLDYIFASKFILTSSSPYLYQFSANDLVELPGIQQYGHKELLRYLPME